MLYEGALLRVLGLFFLLLGVVGGLGLLKMISETVAVILLFLLLIPGGIIGFFVQQNGMLLKSEN